MGEGCPSSTVALAHCQAPRGKRLAGALVGQRGGEFANGLQHAPCTAAIPGGCKLVVDHHTIDARCYR